MALTYTLNVSVYASHNESVIMNFLNFYCLLKASYLTYSWNVKDETVFYSFVSVAVRSENVPYFIDYAVECSKNNCLNIRDILYTSVYVYV